MCINIYPNIMDIQLLIRC